MNQLALLSNKERLLYFEAAGVRLNLAPELIEKDFWVCWTLKQLFSLEGLKEHLTFKGGTSLSKCYNAIGRFSEDIDISIERNYLAPGENCEPSVKESNKENQRRMAALRNACQSMIAQTVLPELEKRIRGILKGGDPWDIQSDPNDPERQTLLFSFPAARKSPAAAYVNPMVKIEFGARADHWPVESGEVIPYMASVIPDAMLIEKTSVRVLAAERTFWEKAAILHMIYHYPDSKTIPPRMSRHYYDLYEMSRAAILDRALKHIELLKSVADHKSLFFKSSWAKYNEARVGTLRLVPINPDRIKVLKTDYRQMRQMFFTEPPSWEHIVKESRALEERINRG